jgi:hypothetical protein
MMGNLSDSGIGKIALIPMVTAPISIISSIAILIMILRSEKGLSKLYHRIIFGLSISDILNSTALSFGTIPMPRGTEHAWVALGNKGTCQAQGFFLTGGIGTVLYNCSLCVFYYLCVKHTMREEDIVLKYEKWLHGVPILWSLTAATIAVVTGSINPDYANCWLQSCPLACHLNEDVTAASGDETQEECRGSRPYLMRWILNGGPVFITSGIICYTMAIIYLTVKNQEERSAAYSFQNQMSHYQTEQSSPMRTGQGQSSRQNSRIRKVWIRSLSYVIAMSLTFVPLYIKILIEMYGGIHIEPLKIMTLILYPMQGFGNLIVFVQPTVSKKREIGNMSLLQALIDTLLTFGQEQNATSNRFGPEDELQAIGIFERMRRRSSILFPIRLPRIPSMNICEEGEESISSPTEQQLSP